MTLDLFFKGLVIGISIAMPVGPIGLLCIRNVLTHGIVWGLLTGLGAACADAIYGAIAGFGITAISSFLEAHSTYIQMIGAVFLCYLGISTFFAKASTSKTQDAHLTIYKTFLATFFLTLTNPMTIISFAGVYAGLGIGLGSANIIEALTTTFGVFIGSAVWWILLSAASFLFKDKMNLRSSVWLNKCSGVVIFSLGTLALIS